MRLNRNVLDKMEALGYIVKKKIGRENEIELTESGRYIACVSGLLE